MGCGSSVQPPLDPITDVQPPEVAEAEAKAPAGPPADLQASGDTPLPTMQNFGPRPGNAVARDSSELEVPTLLDICSEELGADVVDIDAPRRGIEWTKLELLGVGAFGHVYKGKQKTDGRIVAVKELRFSKTTPATQIKAVESEIRIAKKLSHPNIVQQLDTDFVPADNKLYIFLEYVPFGSITSLVSRAGALKELKVRRYTHDILAALLYLHEQGIIHRDVKGANCLVAHGDCIKIADFGTAAQSSKFRSSTFKRAGDLGSVAPPPGFNPLPASAEHKALRGTSYYMAPEVIKGVGYGRRADVWSTGCTVVEMCTGHPPFWETKNQIAAMYRVASGNEPAPIPEHLSSEGRNFLLWCFKRDPNDRATVKYLCGHPWVSLSSITASIQSGVPNATPPPPPPRVRSNIGSQSSGTLNTIMGACEVPTYNPATAHATSPKFGSPPPPPPR